MSQCMTDLSLYAVVVHATFGCRTCPKLRACVIFVPPQGSARSTCLRALFYVDRLHLGFAEFVWMLISRMLFCEVLRAPAGAGGI
jgi:hypothetical protein